MIILLQGNKVQPMG